MKRLTASISIPICVLGMLALTRTPLSASDTATILSVRAPRQSTLTADLDSPFWKHAPGVFANQDTMGNPVTKEVMEIRSRWTQDNLYLLFICAFDVLYLKPDPDPAQETNRLWNWDVAEAFIGNDFDDINRYKEFEVSPQGEWVDLDIDRNKTGGSPDAWRWNSGFKVKARIDKARKVWYAEMCIPFQSISRNPATPGLQLRINFFRTQGSGPNRLLLNWRPTHAQTFHVPAAFGVLQLAPEPQ
jgi:Carbohydrate family 9 binding domain-like